MECKPVTQQDRKKEMMAIHDAMDVLSGKWKIYIISSICHYNKRRFSDILNDVVGISNKMLSKELKELELNKLVERGNTVLVIEHNMDVIKVADHIIDLGPEGGDGGGKILFEGVPEELIKNKESFTGMFLKEEL